MSRIALDQHRMLPTIMDVLRTNNDAELRSLTGFLRNLSRHAKNKDDMGKLTFRRQSQSHICGMPASRDSISRCFSHQSSPEPDSQAALRWTPEGAVKRRDGEHLRRSQQPGDQQQFGSKRYRLLRWLIQAGWHQEQSRRQVKLKVVRLDHQKYKHAIVLFSHYWCIFFIFV